MAQDRFVSLLPHVLRIKTEQVDLTLPAATVAASIRLSHLVNDSGIPTYSETLENLPSPCRGVLYIVTRDVAMRARRADLRVPIMTAFDTCCALLIV